MKATQLQRLHHRLEIATQEFVLTHEISRDALAPALEFKSPQDQEFAAFLCATFAFGNVKSIQKSVTDLLHPLGKTPVANLLKTNDKLISEIALGKNHRWVRAHHMVGILKLLKTIYAKKGSLEKLMVPPAHASIESVIEHFHQYCLDSKILAMDRTFKFLFPRPSAGSACKRMNLFLRWMVRTSPFDLGLWSSLKPSQLVIPLDTHILQQAQSLKITRSKSANWKVATEITNFLKKLDPEDPIRFDFALCHLGMTGRYLTARELGSPSAEC